MLVVPEDGQGPVRQWTLSRRGLKSSFLWVATAIGVGGALAVAALATWPRVGAYDALLHENLALRGRLDARGSCWSRYTKSVYEEAGVVRTLCEPCACLTPDRWRSSSSKRNAHQAPNRA